MALNGDQVVPMLISALASVAAVVAGLLFLASLLMSGAFAGRVPAGADAMGLVVPLFASIAAALLLLVATWLLAANGRLAWIGAHAGWIASAVVFAVGAAAVAVLIAWMERMGAWVLPLGLYCGGVAPLLAVILLLRCAWHTPAQLLAASWPKLMAAPLLLSVLCAIGLALVGAVHQLRRNAANAEHTRMQQATAQAEQARRDALSPLERLREEHAAMSADAPLWVFVASLPDTHDAALREALITRALQVPALDDELARTLGDDHPRYRHGAVELLRDAPDPAVQARWAPLLARAIETSAVQIAADPQWLQPNEFANPDPIAHVAAMRAAATRFAARSELDNALAQLRARLTALPASNERERALAVLAED